METSFNIRRISTTLCSTFQLVERSPSSSSITELEQLKRALKRSQEECEGLSEQLDRITHDFQDACRELDLYKHEPCESVLKYSHDIRLPRSRSFVEIGRATIDLDEHLRYCLLISIFYKAFKGISVLDFHRFYSFFYVF